VIAYTKIAVGKQSGQELPSGTVAPAPLTQHRFQFEKCAQQFVGMDNVAVTIVAVSINDPTPAVARDGAAIARPSSRQASDDQRPVAVSFCLARSFRSPSAQWKSALRFASAVARPCLSAPALVDAL